MDLEQVIQELLKERNRLDALIGALERGLDAPATRPARSSRGRKFMAPAERADVAERMRRYWAARKGISTSSPADNSDAPQT